MTGIKERKKKFAYAPKKKRGDNEPSLAYCIEHADDLAQRVVNEWAAIIVNAAPLPADLEALFEKANRFQNAKQTAENHRDVVTEVGREQEAAEEAATREAFVKGYRDFRRKHASEAGRR